MNVSNLSKLLTPGARVMANFTASFKHTMLSLNSHCLDVVPLEHVLDVFVLVIVSLRFCSLQGRSSAACRVTPRVLGSKVKQHESYYWDPACMAAHGCPTSQRLLTAP